MSDLVRTKRGYFCGTSAVIHAGLDAFGYVMPYLRTYVPTNRVRMKPAEERSSIVGRNHHGTAVALRYQVVH